MKYTVHMMSFYDPPAKREVTVPDNELVQDTDHILERIFYYGQNDFQPQKVCSVSVGDVIELDGTYHMVCPVGFKEITQERFDTLKVMQRPARTMYAYSE